VESLWSENAGTLNWKANALISVQAAQILSEEAKRQSERIRASAAAWSETPARAA